MFPQRNFKELYEKNPLIFRILYLLKVFEFQNFISPPPPKKKPLFFLRWSVVCWVQCDKIGLFIGLWANIQSLWQQVICPNLLHS